MKVVKETCKGCWAKWLIESESVIELSECTVICERNAKGMRKKEKLTANVPAVGNIVIHHNNVRRKNCQLIANFKTSLCKYVHTDPRRNRRKEQLQ